MQDRVRLLKIQSDHFLVGLKSSLLRKVYVRGS